MSIPAVFIDGTLYVALALLTFLTGYFGSDEAAKWISAATLFWVKGILGAASATALAIKLFRSTAFADHQAEKSAQIPSENPKDTTTPNP